MSMWIYIKSDAITPRVFKHRLVVLVLYLSNIVLQIEPATNVILETILNARAFNTDPEQTNARAGLVSRTTNTRAGLLP
jgi:hypothetical protein